MQGEQQRSLEGTAHRTPSARRSFRRPRPLASWRGKPLRVLHNDNPDVAVARGGVAYALGQMGHAPVIGGGSPRSYFLVLDEEQRADKPRRGRTSCRQLHLEPPLCARAPDAVRL